MHKVQNRVAWIVLFLLIAGSIYVNAESQLSNLFLTYDCSSSELHRELSEISQQREVDAWTVWQKCTETCPSNAHCWSSLSAAYYESVVFRDKMKDAKRVAANLDPQTYQLSYTLMLYFQAEYEEAMHLLQPNLEDMVRIVGKCDQSSISISLARELSGAMITWLGSACIGGWKSVLKPQAFSCLNAMQVAQQLLACSLYKEKVETRLIISLTFHLASALDHQKQYDAAWQYYLIANREKWKHELVDAAPVKEFYKSRIYTVKAHVDFFESIDLDELRPVVEKYWEEQRMWLNSNQVVPMFIVGLPRTGSTLLEDRMAKYNPKNVFRLGETSLFYRSVSSTVRIYNMTSSKHCVDEPQLRISVKLLQSMAYAYLNFTSELARTKGFQNKTLLIDKQLDNWFVSPWIHILFPDALVVHMKRNPMDTAISNFFADFDPPIIPWASSPVHLVEWFQFYKEQYERVRLVAARIASWRQKPMWREVQYEELVETEASTIPSLWNMYAGSNIPTSVAVEKSSPKHSDIVITASSRQIRKATYQSSISKWKNFESGIANSPLKVFLNTSHPASDF